ncbi:LOW QUALITY PROTEIN: zinc-finger homeodomain protein 3 [Arachis duranensis]|uniref:LOW QUALITY PROTEIN: zinc-finger homeodomain protein 3 n=1 Tax=Arachis duranensis TaxID=130453 RepID=A0A6P4BHU1_ARADU|nr:LOW QUALITY PROTEIN: zinc-finger homeodomain protein 3 [Arachis duranensis]
MELSSQEGDIPIAVNTTANYGGNGHGAHINIHHTQNPSNGSSMHPLDNGPYNSKQEEEEEEEVVVPLVRYRECLKNHAAAMGGNATDGCGEFMPSGDHGTMEALTCSACRCHRNFHRKEIQGEPSAPPPPLLEYHHHHFNTATRHLAASRKFLHKNMHHHHHLGYPTAGGGNILSAYYHHPSAAPHMLLALSGAGIAAPPESTAAPISAAAALASPRKRFRTKFSQEQKEKMLAFAEKVGWKIQKQEDSVVQNFCNEIGVKRRVLKVWMHNNKHNLAKKNLLIIPPSSST